MTEQILERFYEALRLETDFDIEMFHSDVYYVRAALRARGISATLEEVKDAMLKEGMLPWREYEEAYGVPNWFCKKQRTRERWYEKAKREAEDEVRALAGAD